MPLVVGEDYLESMLNQMKQDDKLEKEYMAKMQELINNKKPSVGVIAREKDLPKTTLEN